MLTRAGFDSEMEAQTLGPEQRSHGEIAASVPLSPELRVFEAEGKRYLA